MKITKSVHTHQFIFNKRVIFCNDNDAILSGIIKINDCQDSALGINHNMHSSSTQGDFSFYLRGAKKNFARQNSSLTPP